MKTNTIYKGENGQRFIHRHLRSSFAVTVMRRVAEGGETSAYIPSKDGSFIWKVTLGDQIEHTHEHEGLYRGEWAVDMPVIRKRKDKSNPLFHS